MRCQNLGAFFPVVALCASICFSCGSSDSSRETSSAGPGAGSGGTAGGGGGGGGGGVGGGSGGSAGSMQMSGSGIFQYPAPLDFTRAIGKGCEVFVAPAASPCAGAANCPVLL